MNHNTMPIVTGHKHINFIVCLGVMGRNHTSKSEYASIRAKAQLMMFAFTNIVEDDLRSCWKELARVARFQDMAPGRVSEDGCLVLKEIINAGIKIGACHQLSTD